MKESKTSIPTQNHLYVSLAPKGDNLTVKDIVSSIDDVRSSLLRRAMDRRSAQQEMLKDIKTVALINVTEMTMSTAAKKLLEVDVPVESYFDQPPDRRTKRTVSEIQKEILKIMQVAMREAFVFNRTLQPGDKAREYLVLFTDASSQLMKLHLRAAKRARRNIRDLTIT